MTANDRREFQRLKLARPLMALLDGANALILDIGVGGAFVEHYGHLRPGAHARLTFRWQGSDVEFLCTTVRSSVVRQEKARAPISQTALQFEQPVGDAEDRLRELMATFVGRILAAQKANAAASAEDESDTLLPKIGDARRSRTQGFLVYRYDGKAWSRNATTSPEQPANGFTVAAYEDDDELEILCRTYERTDADGRQMIRVIAELSAMTVAKK